MNILITGANGQLGHSIQDMVSMSSHHFFLTDICDGYDQLDITDLNAVKTYVSVHAIDCIINCAAWTNVDAAETAGEIVERLNATAPENLAIAMKERNGLLIHISTDYVFGAETYNTPCNEDMTGTPTGVYGQTKLLGEQKIIATSVRHIIIRTAWLYSEYGKNFVKTMLSLTSTKPHLKVVIDQCGTPTYARDLAKAILTITDNDDLDGKYGIYHYSNEGVTSWFDFTKAIAFFSGNTDCKIHPCRSSEFPSPVRRPAYSVLDKTKIKSTFNVEVPYWTDSLRRCLESLR